MKLSPADAALLRAIFEDLMPEVEETAALSRPCLPLDPIPNLPELPRGFTFFDRKDSPS